MRLKNVLDRLSERGDGVTRRTLLRHHVLDDRARFLSTHRHVVDRCARLLTTTTITERARIDRSESQLQDEIRNNALRIVVVAREKDSVSLLDGNRRAAVRTEVL